MKKTGLRYLLGEGVKFANEASGNLYIRCEQIRAEDGTYLMQMIVPAVLKAALHIFLTAIERVLRQHSPDASAASRLGAVVFIPLWRATQHATVRPPHRGGRRFDADEGRTAKYSNRPHDKDKVDVCNGSDPAEAKRWKSHLS